jgi:hypothetical protein
MKVAVLALFCLYTCSAFAQTKPDLIIEGVSKPTSSTRPVSRQFYVGVLAGAGGCHYQYAPSQSNYRVYSFGPSIPAFFELIYGTGKARFGYQFEYQRILNNSYQQQTFGTQNSDTIITDNGPKQHFFCHNLILQYVVYKYKKNFSFVPTVEIGYFHGVYETTSGLLDPSVLNRNRFKVGASFDIEYHVHQVSLVIRPSYGVIPIRSVIDKDGKGFMQLFGIHFGIRWNTIQEEEDPANPPKISKRRAKLLKAAEEDEQ